MAEETRDPRVLEYLKEARETELALLRALESHRAVMPRGVRRDLLFQDIEQTREHLRWVERRLLELGVRPSRRSRLRHQIRLRALRLTSVLTRARHRLRPPAVGELLFENAKQDVALEGRAIANYFALETLARRLGDEATAELAAEIRADEEGMLEAQRREIPELSVAAVRAEVAELSFDMSLTGGWWAYDQMSGEQITEALSRARAKGRGDDANGLSRGPTG